MGSGATRRQILLTLCGGGFLPLVGSGCTYDSERRVRDERGIAGILRSRVSAPHEETLAAYRRAGAKEAKAHVVGERDWGLVDRALSDLPPVYQRVLEGRLESLSFIDAPSSAGSALTRRFEGPDGEPRFDMTLRADVLDLSLSDFLNRKDQALFAEDGTGYRLQIVSSELPALTYVLLHEAVHVLDQSYRISATMRPFASIWADYRSLAEPYASGPLARSAYRRGPLLPAARMPEIYQTLGKSPFVSLYSTASAGEDLAELLAWAHLARRHRAHLEITVLDASGRRVARVMPLQSAAVRARLKRAESIVAAIHAR